MPDVSMRLHKEIIEEKKNAGPHSGPRYFMWLGNMDNWYCIINRSFVRTSLKIEFKPANVYISRTQSMVYTSTKQQYTTSRRLDHISLAASAVSGVPMKKASSTS